MPTERREKLVDVEGKSNPHTKGEVLIKKKGGWEKNSSQRTEFCGKNRTQREQLRKRFVQSKMMLNLDTDKIWYGRSWKTEEVIMVKAISRIIEEKGCWTTSVRCENLQRMVEHKWITKGKALILIL